MIQISKVDSSTERKILIGIIVDSKFLKTIYPSLQVSYFQSKYAQTIVKWVSKHYEFYEEAPFDSIQDIFTKNRSSLKVEEQELIGSLLSSISKDYQKDQGINSEFLADFAMEYFKKREIEIRISNAQKLLDQGKVREAELEILNMKKVAVVQSNWVDPFDDEEVYSTFDEKDDGLFKFPGELGDFMGPLRRGWLVGLSAPFKRGKSFFLNELAVISAMSFRKTAYFSLEMSDTENKERLYKRVTGLSDNDQVIYPVFDCVKNQIGSCKLPGRQNLIRLLDDTGEYPQFSVESEYRPCTYCRDQNPVDYQMCTWYSSSKREETFELRSVYEKIQAFKKIYGNYIRIRSYPRFSANVGDIERDLEMLASTQNFYPDVIIIDYVDILKPEQDDLRGIEKEDQAWMNLARLAGSRHACVVTPTQVNKDALTAATVKTSHTARWVGKLGHVDMMCALNQTEEEKKRGIMRVSIMEHRHKKFLETESCHVLVDFNLGLFHLDSWYKKGGI